MTDRHGLATVDGASTTPGVTATRALTSCECVGSSGLDSLTIWRQARSDESLCTPRGQLALPEAARAFWVLLIKVSHVTVLQLRTSLALGQIIARVSNIRRTGETVQPWCFKPSGYLVVVHVMLGQKISLENCEREALAVAIPAGSLLSSGAE